MDLPFETPISDLGAEVTVFESDKKLAPRSSNQFRVGPPFASTIVSCPIYNETLNTEMTPLISARLDRGFNLIEGQWIGYKRNYFTLVASFCFSGHPLDICSTSALLYVDAENNRHPLLYFKLRLVSSCPEDSKTLVTLVQHTAKRDKGPQFSPPVYNAIPGTLPGHQVMKLVANIRNGDKILRCNRLFYLPHLERRQLAASCADQCILATYPDNKEVSLVARYERIQFLSSAAGSRKQSSTNNKHYTLEVQLLGVTCDDEVVLAYSQTPPLIVRGRSPSNYTSSEKKKKLKTLNQENPEPRKRRVAKENPRPILGRNTTLENSFSAVSVDPELLHSLTKPKIGSALHASDISVGKESTREKIPDYVIPQDLTLVPQPSPSHVASPVQMSLPDVTYTSLSDKEPLNAHFNYRPKPLTFSKLEDALKRYEAAKETLEDLLQCSLAAGASWCLSMRLPQEVPDLRKTSTPLQIRHLLDIASTPCRKKKRPCLTTQCKHGFKKRPRIHHAPKVYDSSDLCSENYDSSFDRFKEKLNKFRRTIRLKPPPDRTEMLLSPLTTMNTEKEYEYVQWESSSLKSHREYEDEDQSSST